MTAKTVVRQCPVGISLYAAVPRRARTLRVHPDGVSSCEGGPKPELASARAAQAFVTIWWDAEIYAYLQELRVTGIDAAISREWKRAEQRDH